MKGLKIICHDGQEFTCENMEELRTFTSNYRRLEGERIEREFPGKAFLIDHVEAIEMTEDEYQQIPATVDSNRYFRGGV